MVLAAVVVVGLAAFASALLDRPDRAARLTVTVPGPKAAIWEELVNLAAYNDWNPVFRNASGGTQEGDTLRLDLVLSGGTKELEPEVLVSRPDRKLWWQHRTFLPGIRDWEYEVILRPLGDGNVVVDQRLRVEGLLSVFEDQAELRDALDRLSQALLERREAS